MSEGYVDPETGEIHVPEEGASTDLVPRAGADVELVPNRLAALLTEMKDRAELDPEQVAQEIVNRILHAATIDEVLASGEARHAREILDQAVIVTAIKLNESDYADHAGIYMVADCSDPEFGESFAVTCGSATVMAQLYRLSELNAFPCKVKFTQSRKATRNGFFPMRLEPA